MAEYLNVKNVVNLLPERIDDSNKSTYGRILNIAGSNNYRGAAYLSSVSALKIGAGYVTLAAPDIIIPYISAMLPELTFMPLNTFVGAISNDNLINIDSYDVISVGCGITTSDKTSEFIFNLLKNRDVNKKFVIDADAINILANRKSELSLKNSVITPHPKELSRLLGVDINEILDSREKYARIASQTFDCITVLKGHNSIITDGDRIYYNSTGNSALAKAGTGDVLTGIIAGLAAQGLELFDAAKLGVFVHGLSGEIASDDLTQYCVLASDVVEYIPSAINEMLSED